MTWKDTWMVAIVVFLFYGFYHMGYRQGREDLGLQMIPILDNPHRLDEAMKRYHMIRDYSTLMDTDR